MISCGYDRNVMDFSSQRSVSSQKTAVRLTATEAVLTWHVWCLDFIFMANLTLARSEAIAAYTIARISGSTMEQAWRIAERRVRPLIGKDYSDLPVDLARIYTNTRIQYDLFLYPYLQNNIIPAIRISSAQAKGRAKQYAYWGIARYEIGWSKKHNLPVSRCVGRARSDRRSIRKAEQDADEIIEASNCLLIASIGVLSTTEVIYLNCWILDSYVRQTIASESFDVINNLNLASECA
jgi:hypothetical protein